MVGIYSILVSGSQRALSYLLVYSPEHTLERGKKGIAWLAGVLRAGLTLNPLNCLKEVGGTIASILTANIISSAFRKAEVLKIIRY